MKRVSTDVIIDADEHERARMNAFFNKFKRFQRTGIAATEDAQAILFHAYITEGSK